jgi:hypothetical protein
VSLVAALLKDGASDAPAVTRGYGFDLTSPVGAASLLFVFGGAHDLPRLAPKQALKDRPVPAATPLLASFDRCSVEVEVRYPAIGQVSLQKSPEYWI